MTTCVDTLGPGAVLCPTDHCDEFQESTSFHAICNCIDWQGNPIPNCNPKDNLYPVTSGECYNPNTQLWQPGNTARCKSLGQPWYYRTCYCCCSCFASDTPIAVPGNATRQLGDFLIGDQVLAAARSGNGWTWTAQTLQYSNGSPPTTGTGPTDGNLMLYIQYGNGSTLISTSNQLFALADGNLKRADQLVPGTDMLSGEDGSGVPITMIASGYYKGAVHHIGLDMVTYEDFDGSIDNHLINANGVVVGDYLLQAYQDTAKMKPHMEGSAPSIGTHAYAEAYGDLLVMPYVVGPEHVVTGAEITVKDFEPSKPSTIEIPEDAISLFTPRQQAMLLDPDIPKRGFTDKTNMEQVRYFTTLYSAFYPGVTVTFDWESTHPSVFAYDDDGTPTVLIGGMFMRLGPLYGQAMAMAMAFGIAALSFSGDRDNVGQALFDGAGVVMLTALDTYWTETTQAAFAQFDALLQLLAKKDGGSTGDEGGLPASCLAEVIDAAVSSEELPGCAGGVVPGTLALEKAGYTPGVLEATFSAALDPKSAATVSNYAVSPGGKVTGAKLDPQNDSGVLLAVELAPGDYSLAVEKIKAADGSGLDPNASGVQFQVKAD